MKRIKEKAKAYDKAINKAKSLYKAAEPMSGCNVLLETIFPELKESEDERIRKELISFFTERAKYTEDSTFNGLSSKEIIAWLEKLGKQKLNPVLDIEIPFGAKDSELQEASYYIPEGFHAEIESNRVIIKKGEQKPTEEYNITGIKSKHAQGKLGEMIKKLEIEKQSEQKPIKEHNACEFCEDRYGCVSPCSMKLVEKEKLAEVEPKFKVSQIIKKKSFNLGFIIVKIEDGFYYNNMGDYFPFTDQDNWQLVEQNPTWSEEDEEVINLTCSILYSNFNENENFDKNQMCIGEIIDKLKSLRPQSQWKPSDEHYELEEFAKIVRGNLTGISKAVQKLFEAKYLQLTGNKMYGGFKD